MSAIAVPSTVQPARVQPPYAVYPLTVDRYHRMIQAGILTEDDPVELLEGWIVPKMPRNPPHDSGVGLAQDLVTGKLPAGWHIRVQSAITLTDSEPEPDLAVVRGARRDYKVRHPGPADVGLLIEVADSSLAEDRDNKGRIYARAGIPVYWIVNLVQQQVEVYTQPDSAANPPGYRHRHDYSRGQQVPLVLMAQMIADVPVDDLLP